MRCVHLAPMGNGVVVPHDVQRTLRTFFSSQVSEEARSILMN